MDNNNNKKPNKKLGFDIAILVLGIILLVNTVRAILNEYFIFIPRALRSLLSPMIIFIPIIIFLFYLRNKK